MHPFLSIVVPVYNNASSLPALVLKIKEVMEQAEGEYEIVVVDDKSADNSREVLQKLKQENPNIRTVFFEKNVGQWEATLRGLAFAKGAYIATIDADLQYDPADILRLYRHLKEKNLLLVYGIPARMLGGMGGWRNHIQNFFLKKQITSSFKVLHRSVVFDSDNNFICRRHFEGHEKFHVPAEQKSWMQVNIKGKEGGGFRRHVGRNMNLMLTYLPEYNLHFRHPLILAGIGFVIIAALLSFLPYSSDNFSSISLIATVVTLIIGIFLCIVGIRYQLKYRPIAEERKKFLAGIRS